MDIHLFSTFPSTPEKAVLHVYEFISRLYFISLIYFPTDDKVMLFLLLKLQNS